MSANKSTQKFWLWPYPIRIPNENGQTKIATNPTLMINVFTQKHMRNRQFLWTFFLQI